MRIRAGPAPIVEHPRAGARIEAYLAPRALAQVDRCQKDWCKVRVGSADGWVAASEVWGASDAAQCR
jgi:SH3-like domain-containing protein